MELDITPIAIVSITFAASIVIVGIISLFIHRTQQARFDLIRAALERGQPLPPELLDRPRSHRTDLQRGVLFGLAGVGLSLLLWTRGNENWGVGLAVVCVGAGYVASHLLRPRDPAGAPSPR